MSVNTKAEPVLGSTVNKRTIDDVEVRGRRVLVRLDLNVPLDDHSGITDDRRIRAALPTVRKLVGDGGRLILISHLGRPTGGGMVEKRLSLAPVAERLSELLNLPVPLVAHGDAGKTASQLKDGACCLLENLRFNTAETIKDKHAANDADLRARKDRFAASLAELADVYVNDAFGTCHRDNASMLTVPQRMRSRPRVVGYLVADELKFLGRAMTDPKRPFVVILGGAKVSDKVGAIEALLDRCDTLLIGGAMAYTFAAAANIATGKSLVEPDKVDVARRLREVAGGKLRLPVDSVAARAISGEVQPRVCAGPIPEKLIGLDIGPETVSAYREIIAGAGTVFWNGPMGVFETPPFDAGTRAVAQAVADATDRGAVTVIGGGDSAAAVEAAGLADRVSHVSTGGGASLKFLEGKPFAAIEVLDDA